MHMEMILEYVVESRVGLDECRGVTQRRMKVKLEARLERRRPGAEDTE